MALAVGVNDIYSFSWSPLLVGGESILTYIFKVIKAPEKGPLPERKIIRKTHATYASFI